jgi:hypothetical protein
MNRYITAEVGEVATPTLSQFRYINCIGEYENTRHYIRAVTFDISRYGKYEHTLKFLFPLTIKGAIEKAEEYLSQPLTKEYYQKIQDDLFHNEYDYETSIKWYNNRGDCLTDAIYLECINQPNPNGFHINLWCGS